MTLFEPVTRSLFSEFVLDRLETPVVKAMYKKAALRYFR